MRRIDERLELGALLGRRLLVARRDQRRHGEHHADPEELARPLHAARVAETGRRDADGKRDPSLSSAR
jgi:hypothetical protein